MTEATFDIRMQVMWNRLISVVEEQAMTLLRTAFSTSVREAGDLSAGVFDPEGRMLAQAVTGTRFPLAQRTRRLASSVVWGHTTTSGRDGA